MGPTADGAATGVEAADVNLGSAPKAIEQKRGDCVAQSTSQSTIDKPSQGGQSDNVERHSRCGGEADRLVMSGCGRVEQGFEEGLTRGR